MWNKMVSTLLAVVLGVAALALSGCSEDPGPELTKYDIPHEDEGMLWEKPVVIDPGIDDSDGEFYIYHKIRVVPVCIYGEPYLWYDSYRGDFNSRRLIQVKNTGQCDK